MATIQILRNTGATASPVPADASNPGELAYSLSGFNNADTTNTGLQHQLTIADGNAFRIMIGPQRQFELYGNQSAAAGAIKTFGGTSRIIFSTATNLGIGGGTINQVLTKVATAGDAVVWADVPPSGLTQVFSDATLTGLGTAANELGINPSVWGTGLTITADVVNIDTATATQTLPGTANNIFLTPLSLVGVPGTPGPFGLPVAQLATGAKTIVPAINEILGLVGAGGGGLIFTGSYDVNANQVTPVGPGSVGALPVASAANDGWFVVATTAGNGIGNAPPVRIEVGDWLISGQTPGTPGAYQWFRLAIGIVGMLAANVGVVPPVNGQGNVQDALEDLQANKLTTVNVDGVSIIGTGAAGGANALRVDIVDGGTF